MLTPRQKYEVCRVKSGTALIPFFDTRYVSMGISTYTGDLEITHLNGSKMGLNPTKQVDTFTNQLKNIELNNGAIYNGNVSLKFNRGLKDAYSFSMTDFQSDDNTHKLNIQNWGEFIMQFPKINNYRLFFYAYNVPSRYAVIKGDLAVMPDSVEKIFIDSLNIANNNTATPDVWFNLNTLKATSNLKYFKLNTAPYTSVLKINGDLAKLPQSVCLFQYSAPANGSSITYTAGKVWESSFDTLSIPLILTTTELDNLLIDMNNSITTKIGAGVIALGGYRSSASDAAVASLQAKGFTVNVTRNPLNVNSFTDSALLRLDFQNNFDVYSNSGLNIISGGNSNQPTFALSGRKAGEYCAVFNGSQSIKTTTNLPINSDKVTIAFWMKTTQTSHSKIVDLNVWSGGNRFTIGINDGAKIRAISGPAPNVCDNQSAINNGEWKHIVFTFDRAQVANQEIKMYINGVLATTTNGISNNGTGNFENQILTIGASGSSLYFNGSLTRLKIYNYPFTPTDVTNLYNSEL